MAYIGSEPWHGLGNKPPTNQPIEVWQQKAAMDRSIRETPVLFNGASEDELHAKADAVSKVLYRSDTQAALSVVSKRYKVVQPDEVLEFYRDLTEVGGFQLETAVVLKAGKKLWALVKTGQSVLLKDGDKEDAYLLLATS